MAYDTNSTKLNMHCLEWMHRCTLYVADDVDVLRARHKHHRQLQRPYIKLNIVGNMIAKLVFDYTLCSKKCTK